jgi:3'-5' exoribonuclease
VRGRFALSEQYGPQIKVDAVASAPEGTYDPTELSPSTDIPLERLEADMRELIGTIQDRDLRLVLDCFFGPETAAWKRFRTAPAAKMYHQAFTGGLLEHALSVAQAVSAASNFFPGIDRDVAVAGALLHDIGKTEAYNDDPLAIDLTNAGRLEGEIPLGYYKVRRAIEEIEGFDAATAQHLLHIILSHHGSLEHGSPVVPATREATLVHTMDNLGGTLGSFDRLERELPQGAEWSRFDRGISGAAYFGKRVA